MEFQSGPGRNYDDLDLVIRRRELRLCRGTGRRGSSLDPSVPDRIHLGEVGHVCKQDRRGEHLRNITAGLGQQVFDLIQDRPLCTVTLSPGAPTWPAR